MLKSKVCTIARLIISQIFGFVTIIFDLISTFANLNLFINRPKYVNSYEPYSYSDSDRDYVKSLSDCETDFTDSLVDFVNGLNTKYYTFATVFCILFSLLSVVITHLMRYVEYCTEDKHKNPENTIKVSIILSSLSYMFSVPAMYATKIEFKDCLVVDGVLETFATRPWEIFYNVALWLIIFLPILFYCLEFCFEEVDSNCLDVITTFIAILVVLFYLLYILMAFTTKFGCVKVLKIGWDISITFNLVTEIIEIWFNRWRQFNAGLSS